MSDPTLGELIDSRVDYLLDQLPANQEVIVTGVYDDNYVNVRTKNDNEIVTYIPVNTPGRVGDEGVLIFLNGDINQPFCLIGADLSNYYTKKEVDDLITGDKDLEDYVKKSDVRLKFDLEDNGTIIIGIDIGDGF